MNHVNWNDLLELLDDRVAPERRAELEGHLTGCRRCRRLAESQRSFERLVRALPAIEPSREFTGRILGALQGARRERISLRLLAILGAGIPLALVGGLLVYAIAVGTGSAAEGGKDLFGGAFGDLSATLEKVQSLLAPMFGTTGDTIAHVAQADVLAIAALTAASILLLLLADRLVLHRLNRSRL